MITGEWFKETADLDLIYTYGYQGQFAERDEETGWNHFELREYDPVVGRWMSKDPYGQYWSPYVGMGNDPVSATDPNGGYTKLQANILSFFNGGGDPYQSGYDNDGKEVWGFNKDGISHFGKDHVGEFWSSTNDWDILARRFLEEQAATASNDQLRQMGQAERIMATRGGDGIAHVQVEFEVALAVWTLGSGNLAKGLSVIGPRSTYREFAQKIGANFLDVTDEAWSMRKNVEFLQGVVRRGDDVIFSGKYNADLLNPKSILAQEIRYLQRHGYSWNDDFSRMIKK